MGSLNETPQGSYNGVDQNTSQALKEKAEGVSQKVQRLGEKSSQMAQQVGTKISQNIDTAMNSTAVALDKTSQRFSKASDYFRDKNSEQLVTEMSGVIRRNPIQSLAAGLLLGVLVGRLFK